MPPDGQELSPGNATPPRARRGVVAVIAIGGGVGSVLRYLLSRAVHPAADGFPTATLVTNLLGALLLGALVVAVTEVWRPHRLVRPALGTGLLGGFTTFSTLAEETRAASPGIAAAYLLATVVGGLLLAAAGMAAVRRLEPWLHPAPAHEFVDPHDPELP
jgi:fluoride exporter